MASGGQCLFQRSPTDESQKPVQFSSRKLVGKGQKWQVAGRIAEARCCITTGSGTEGEGRRQGRGTEAKYTSAGAYRERGGGDRISHKIKTINPPVIWLLCCHHNSSELDPTPVDHRVGNQNQVLPLLLLGPGHHFIAIKFKQPVVLKLWLNTSSSLLLNHMLKKNATQANFLYKSVCEADAPHT